MAFDGSFFQDRLEDTREVGDPARLVDKLVRSKWLLEHFWFRDHVTTTALEYDNYCSWRFRIV